MVTSTVYDINDNVWTLELKGAMTPDEIILTQDGIIIEYPSYEIENPVICPKFTFRFIGTPEKIEQFGVIQEYNQPFTLTYKRSGVTYTWNGYLIDDVFSVPNTGFEEVIEINGISELEGLKYRSYDLADSDILPSIAEIMAYVLRDVTKTLTVTNTSFVLPDLGYVSNVNWYDEDGVPMNMLEALKKICTFFCAILEIDFRQRLTLSSYSQLWKEDITTVDYSTVGHRDISETYSTTDNYLSASIVDSVLKPEDALVNLSSNECTEPPYLYQIRSGYYKHFGLTKVWRAWKTYETHLHVIREGEYPGWTFPHYYYTGYEAADWDNPGHLIFYDEQIPVAGMYGISYRAWETASGIPDTPLTNCFLIKTFHRTGLIDQGNEPRVMADNKPYAMYSGSLTATKDDYLLLNGKLGWSARWGQVDSWETHTPSIYSDDTPYQAGYVDNKTLNYFNNNYTGVNHEWADIAVPLINKVDVTANFITGSYFTNLFYMEINFKDKWWYDDDWHTVKGICTVPMPNRGGCEVINLQIPDVHPPVHVPLYQSLGSGFAIRFGKRQDGTGNDNIGSGPLKINLFFHSPESTVIMKQALTVWLQDFNFNMVKGADEVGLKKTPQSPVYEYGNKKEPKYSQITSYLMSSYENISSFSQVYKDAGGNTPLDTIDYALPTGLNTAFEVTEKPEEHTLRVIKQILSSRVILNDVIDFLKFDSLRQVKYKNQLLVRDNFTVDALNNTVNVNWIRRKFNYN
jgi:hypothetical protein